MESKLKIKKTTKESIESAKDTIFTCMMCGKENKGIVFCNHGDND